jgi:hypothetical protein
VGPPAALLFSVISATTLMRLRLLLKGCLWIILTEVIPVELFLFPSLDRSLKLQTTWSTVEEEEAEDADGENPEAEKASNFKYNDNHTVNNK